MRLTCPYCGDRDAGEFVHRGDAAPTRPENGGADEDAAMFAYVYLRDNPAGPITEHWYHAAGCRRWLTVTRDTVTHTVTQVRA
jgi:methylglutamate dehydrogenase subunit B